MFTVYQEHARLKGFSVAKRAAHKVSGEDKYVVIICDRGRKRRFEISSKRIDCPARINAIKQVNGCWVVSKICINHNHDLNPEMSCKNIKLLEVQAGGPENLGCLPKDCRNFIEKRRRLRLGDGDAEAIRKLFITMQLRDRNFFNLMDVDDEGRLCNVLWIHPRSKAAYEEFHDIISFDTTYLVNKYKMPFATFVGINHHGQSILLGCALVTHEDARSFKWLFMNWLEAMGNIHPTAILTDQCESIRITLRDVMPNTIHRFCLWHILSKVPQKFKNVVDFDKAIVEFKAMVYDNITIGTFESKWAEFVRSHGMEGSMISTQRSEGMHAYFDGYVHSMSTLKQFVEQYEIAISNKIQKEFRADHESKSKVMKCISQFEWENQFQRSYTNSMFNLVQKEIMRVLYCHFISPTEEESIEAINHVGIEKYKVLERSIVNNWYHKEFTYTVMSMKDIHTINERYLLRRWRKDVPRRHSSIFFAGGYPHMIDEYKKFQELERCFQECSDLSIGIAEKMKFVKQKLIDLNKELLNWNPIVEVASSAHSIEHMAEEQAVGVKLMQEEVGEILGAQEVDVVEAMEGEWNFWTRLKCFKMLVIVLHYWCRLGNAGQIRRDSIILFFDISYRSFVEILEHELEYAV
ncbi:hypothetical protein ZIOFF_001392 [Zingiber officinale]|uniref:Protein FAR1-RELATED SEQUENCE n=1 Tax=Zingiber officinale TaxID=94328 RepID=A0A8J5I5U5_ZINOF|nr:hypothetical protein ZIOFF_001392 [Zingiber officinale]